MTVHHLEQLEKKEPAEISEQEERLARERLERQLDRSTLDDIERKFGQYIPPARMEKLRREPVRFLDHEDYVRHLKETGIETSENKRILGDANGRVYIDRKDILVPRTLAHERLHQTSDKLYRGMLGKQMDEGTTEYFAGQLRSDFHIADRGSCYPQEHRLIQTLFARVGDKTIAKAYFQGDWMGLKREVDGQLGDGALTRISALAKQGKFREAEEIIKKGL